MNKRASLHGLHGRGDFEKFGGDRALAEFVVFEGELLDELVGVVGGGFHGDHPGRVFGGAGFDVGLEDLVVHVERQDRGERRKQKKQEEWLKKKKAIKRLTGRR